MTDKNDRITWREACEILRCSKTTLYRAVYEGRISAYGIGRRNRYFSRTECENLILTAKKLDFCEYGA